MFELGGDGDIGRAGGATIEFAIGVVEPGHPLQRGAQRSPKPVARELAGGIADYGGGVLGDVGINRRVLGLHPFVANPKCIAATGNAHFGSIGIVRRGVVNLNNRSNDDINLMLAGTDNLRSVGLERIGAGGEDRVGGILARVGGVGPDQQRGRLGAFNSAPARRVFRKNRDVIRQRRPKVLLRGALRDNAARLVAGVRCERHGAIEAGRCPHHTVFGEIGGQWGAFITTDQPVE